MLFDSNKPTMTYIAKSAVLVNSSQRIKTQLYAIYKMLSHMNKHCTASCQFCQHWCAEVFFCLFILLIKCTFLYIWCCICIDAQIPSEVYLSSHLRGKKHKSAMKEANAGKELVKQEIVSPAAYFLQLCELKQSLVYGWSSFHEDIMTLCSEWVHCWICEAVKQTPVLCDQETFNLRHILDASPDHPDPRLTQERERQTSMRKRCKKLRQRMTQKWVGYQGSPGHNIKPAVSSILHQNITIMSSNISSNYLDIFHK